MTRVRLAFSWIAFAPLACAQDLTGSVQNAALPPPSLSEKWSHFVTETFTPLTLGAEALTAGASQVTNSTPLYGREAWPAYPERYAASVGDILSENFFGDFLLASAFHEDTRYIRRGPEHKLWGRIGYAISRSAVTRTDSGGGTFNYSNILGTAMSATLSNAYYPPESRNARAAAANWGTSVAESGFANLLPEFWPDFRAWVKRHLRSRH